VGCRRVSPPAEMARSEVLPLCAGGLVVVQADTEGTSAMRLPTDVGTDRYRRRPAPRDRHALCRNEWDAWGA
jgi:hypothetical protein